MPIAASLQLHCIGRGLAFVPPLHQCRRGDSGPGEMGKPPIAAPCYCCPELLRISLLALNNLGRFLISPLPAGRRFSVGKRGRPKYGLPWRAQSPTDRLCPWSLALSIPGAACL